MSSSRDFVAATIADALLPVVRRPVQDVIYETIDERQIPTRTDFTEIRDLVNSLRGQLTGATAGVKRLAESVEELNERLEALEATVAGAAAQFDRLKTTDAALAALQTRLAAIEASPAASSAPAVTTTPAAVAAAHGCQVPACDRKVRARGFCARHYQQWRRGTLDGFPSPDA